LVEKKVYARGGEIASRGLWLGENAIFGFEKWVFPFMTTKLTLDRAGRVLIPKTLREEWRLNPGDTLQLDSQGEETVTLRPVRPRALLKKELGVWVYQGETASASIPGLIDREREKRLRELLG
jgi:AbrB family looped-hinge helix DNA binding protein